MSCAIRTPIERPRPRAWLAVVGAVALLGGLLAPLPVARGAEGEWGLTGALDTPLRWQSASALAVGTLADEFVDDAMGTIGAVDAWDAGQRGDGALVAVIDTGVDPVGALDGAVAGEIDFTGEGGGDGYGHGTYMASLIAARGRQAPGVADEAGILSLKVADSEGMTDLRTVLAALQWLEGPGRSLGIRVASLALGVDPDTPQGALLDAASARLTAAGVLVVTASGNDADEQSLAAPASAPGSLSVGALDDDEVAPFTGTGPDRAGITQPDVLAPGVGVVGHAPPGSAIIDDAADEGADPDRLDQGHLLGNGTSVSAALGAGVAALASAANPELDGPELAEALGEGSEGSPLDAIAAIEAAESARTSRPDPQTLPNGRSRPVHPRSTPTEFPLPPVADWAAAQWNGTAWTTAGWAADRWQETAWDGNHPKGSGWDASDWTADDWSAAAWDGTSWVADDWPSFHRQLSRIGDVRRHGDEYTLTAGEGAPWELVVKWNVVKWNVVKWNVVKWNVAGWTADAWSVVKWNAAAPPRTNAAGVVKWNGGTWNVVKWNRVPGAHATTGGVVKWNGGSWNVVKWNQVPGAHATTGGVVKWNADAWSVVKWNGGSPQARPDVVKWNQDPTPPTLQ